jgi:hypothetical protein
MLVRRVIEHVNQQHWTADARFRQRRNNRRHDYSYGSEAATRGEDEACSALSGRAEQ